MKEVIAFTAIFHMIIGFHNCQRPLSPIIVLNVPECFQLQATKKQLHTGILVARMIYTVRSQIIRF